MNNFFFLLLLLAACQQTETVKVQEKQTPERWMLFYLGGQSNMDGYGYNKDLPEDLNQTIDDVYIFDGNQVPDNTPDGGLGRWSPLKPGYGTGFRSDGNQNFYSDRFGPELSFGRRMKALFPGQKIAIIKYARGGSSIADTESYGTWTPEFDKGQGLNQYDAYLTTLRSAFAKSDINEDGREDVLVPFGIAWMQGESDAVQTPAIAMAYEANLKQLIDLMRASLREDDLPVAIGKIKDSGMDEDGLLMDHLAIVHQAQANFCEKDAKATLVNSTENYSFLSDPWHYTSPDYIDLGQQFAEALAALIKNGK